MKVLVHAHTRWSYDGFLEPADLAARAAQRGFGAILVSDHVETLDRPRFEALVEACRAVPGVIVIPGVERSFAGYHVCAFGIDRWVEGDDLASWATAARAAGGLLSAAHPIRYRHRIPSWVLDEVDLVEVWNAHRRYNGSVVPDPRSWSLVRASQVPIASQDVHRGRDLNRVGVVIADVTSAAAVLDEIRAGRVMLAGPVVSTRAAPRGARAFIYTGVQHVRPAAWAVPVRAFRLAKRLRRLTHR